MIIQTKFDINKEVFFIKNNKVEKAKIYSYFIKNDNDNDKIEIFYQIINENREYLNWGHGHKDFPENYLFKSKEELIKTL